MKKLILVALLLLAGCERMRLDDENAWMCKDQLRVCLRSEAEDCGRKFRICRQDFHVSDAELTDMMFGSSVQARRRAESAESMAVIGMINSGSRK